MTAPFDGFERLSHADRALLEATPDKPWLAHDQGKCDECHSGRIYLSYLLHSINETILGALGHGHPVTIVPHPSEWTIGIVIHPRAGECGSATENDQA